MLGRENEENVARTRSATLLSTSNYPGGKVPIYTTLLVQLCDFVAPLVLIVRASMGKENFIGYIWEIQNIFVLLNIEDALLKPLKIKSTCIIHSYFIHSCWNNAFKGIVVNRTSYSINEEWLEYTPNSLFNNFLFFLYFFFLLQNDFVRLMTEFLVNFRNFRLLRFPT